jgi:ATP-dependent Lon protease
MTKQGDNVIVFDLDELIANIAAAEGKRTKTNTRAARSRKRKSNTEIKNPEYDQYEETEQEYYNGLDDASKKYVAALETRIGDLNKDKVPMRFKILMSNIDPCIKAIAIKKLGHIGGMSDHNGEYYKTITWIDSLCKLPIGKYRSLPVDSSSCVQDIRDFIRSAQNKLDEMVYGHKEAKDQIIRFIAQKISNPSSTGNVIGLCSPPGCGKTQLAKHGVSKALDLPFSFVSLGGLDDSNAFHGFSSTYEGSTYGKIADTVMKAGCMNPVMFFDELDKVSKTEKGEEIVNLLIHLTDSTQNDKFEDKYFVDVALDMSKCLMIFSYNDESLINPILKDRMIRINIEGYKLDDKVKIAQNYLLRDLCAQFGFDREDIIIADDVIKHMVNNRIETEQGVRNLKRALELVLSNINLELILEESNMALPIEITESMANRFVKLPKNSDSEKMNMIYL